MTKSKLIYIICSSAATVAFTLAASLLVMFCLHKYTGLSIPLFEVPGEVETNPESGIEYDGYDGETPELPDGFDWEDLEGFIELPENMESQMWPTVSNGYLGMPPALPWDQELFEIKTSCDGVIYLKNASYGDYNGQGWGAAKEYTQTLQFGSAKDGYGSASYLTGFVMQENGYLTDTVEIIPKVDRYATPYYMQFSADSSPKQTSDVYSKGDATSGYSVTYFSDVDWRTLKPVQDGRVAAFEAEYRKFVYDNYLYVDSTTDKFMKDFAEDNGLMGEEYSDKIKLIEGVAMLVRASAKLDPMYDTKLDSEANVAVAFLSKYEKGYVQHFATAATLMYRSLGIPARYTTGHAADCEANVDKKLTVLDGHSWVEVYMDGIGWICIDTLKYSMSALEPDDGEDPIGLPENYNPMEHMFNVIAEEDGYIYLRIMSYGDYTGHSWLNATEYDVLMDGQYSAYYLPHTSLEGRNEALTVVIEPVSEYARSKYMLAYYPAIPSTSGVAVQKSDVYVSADARKTYKQTYYSIGDWGIPPISTAYEEYEREYREYVYDTYLEIDNITEQYMLSLAKTYGLDAYNDNQLMAQICAIAQFIKGSAEYNTNYDRKMDQEPNIAISFLNTYKQGICQHYATAATLMFRALGMPARYTVGYVAEGSPEQSVEVLAKNAHAWVEVYIDGFGWLRVEVTAGYESEQIHRIELVPEDAIYMWNDSVQYPAKVLGFEKFEALGYVLEAEMTGYSAPGHYDTKVEKYTIYDPDGNDVTYLFDVNTEKLGKMDIFKDALILTPEDIEYEWDGSFKYPVNVRGFESYAERGYKLLDVKMTGFSDVGVHATYIESYRIEDANGNDVTANVEVITGVTGKMTIRGGTLVLTPSKTYCFYDEGVMQYPDSVTGYEVFSAGGYTFDLVTDGAEDIGLYQCYVTDWTITAPNGTDVTELFDVDNSNSGALYIVNRVITLTPEDIEHTYVKNETKYPEALKGFEDFEAMGYQINNVKYTGFDLPGIYKSYVLSCNIIDPDGNNVTKLFTLDKSHNGNLIISGAKITLTPAKTYAAYEKDVTKYPSDVLGFDEYRAVGYDIVPVFTGYSEQGKYTSYVIGYNIYDGDGKDITQVFDVDISNGEVFYVVDYNITLTPEDIEYDWDGYVKYPISVIGFDDKTNMGFTLGKLELTGYSDIGVHESYVIGCEIYDPDGNCVTEDFNINYGKGVLAINSLGTITLIPEDIYYFYEEGIVRTPVAVLGFEEYADKFVLEVEMTRAKNIGVYNTAVTKYKITDLSGRDVTELFSIETPEEGKMYILDTAVSLYPADAECIRDGEYKTPTTVLGFEEYEKLNFKIESPQFTGSKVIGIHETKLTGCVIIDPYGVDVTSSFQIDTSITGTLIIRAAEEDTILIEIGTEETETGEESGENIEETPDFGYDYEAKWEADKTYTFPSQVVGFDEYWGLDYRIEVTTTTVTAPALFAGDTLAGVLEYHIYDSYSRDITELFNVVNNCIGSMYVYADLNFDGAHITVPYDGKPHYADKNNVTVSEKWAGLEALGFTYEIIPQPGCTVTEPNTIEKARYDVKFYRDGDDVSELFQINCTYDKIVVTNRSIKLAASNVEITRSELKKHEWYDEKNRLIDASLATDPENYVSISEGTIAEGHSIKSLSLSGRSQGAALGETSISISNIVIVDENGKDVTRHYNISTEIGKLTIKR